MIINWYGHSCFRIDLKGETAVEALSGQVAQKSTNLTLVTDPFEKKIGLTPPRFKADIALVSHAHYDHNYIEPFKESFLINEPGEYEVRGLFIKGIKSFHDNKGGKERGSNVIFKIEAEGIKLVHLGDFGQKELEGAQLDEIDEVDILMIPVGGKYTIGPNEAQHVANQIEPRIVIPMHYKIKGLNLDISGPDAFLKTMGATGVKPVEKLSVKSSELKNEETRVIVFKPPS
jgi:L-ascorbate metabolism protein UlaG (beta-lactamase superfamily)